MANRDRQSEHLHRVHRMVFVTKLMQESYMTEKNCRAFVKRICNAQSDAEVQTVYQDLLKESNDELEFAKLKIKSVLNPADHTRYIGLVNTRADESSKSASSFTIPQRDYFRAVLEHIATSVTESHRGPGTPCSSMTDLLHHDPPPPETEGTQVKKMSQNEKQHTLLELIRQGWLMDATGREGYLCIGPRTFLELGQLLHEMEDLPEATKQAWESVI